MANEWGVAKKQAMKILGGKGKIPDDKALFASFSATGKAMDVFKKYRDDIETKITDLQDHLENYSSMLDQYEARLEKDNLGLDKNNKDDAKKITQAQGVLGEALTDIEKDCDEKIKGFKEVARHLILVAQYKLAAH